MNRSNGQACFAIAALLLAVFAMSGCQSVMSRKFIENPESFKGLTKRQVYEQAGLPDRVLYSGSGDAALLYYVGRESKGGGILLGNPIILAFGFRRSHTGSDTQILRVENNHVVEITSLTTTNDLRYGVWPF